jgi:hypothetical protein
VSNLTSRGSIDVRPMLTIVKHEITLLQSSLILEALTLHHQLSSVVVERKLGAGQDVAVLGLVVMYDPERRIRRSSVDIRRLGDEVITRTRVRGKLIVTRTIS